MSEVRRGDVGAYPRGGGPVVVASRSAFLAAVPGATPAAYPGAVFGPTGGDVYVVSRAGIYAGFAPEATLQVFEPSLAGREVAVMRDAIFEAGVGAVAKIADAR